MSLTQPIQQYQTTNIRQQIIFMQPEQANQALVHLFPRKRHEELLKRPDSNFDANNSDEKKEKTRGSHDKSQSLINKLAIQGAGLASFVMEATEKKGVNYQNDGLCAVAWIMSDLFKQIDQLNDL